MATDPKVLSVKKGDVKAPCADPVTGETLPQYFNRRNVTLKQDQSSFLQHWRDLSKYLSPRSSRFFVTEKNQNGNRRNTAIINNTGTLALRTLSAGMMSGITSPSRPWFNLRTHNNELNRVQAVKVWLDKVRTLIGETFLKSNLYTTLPVVYEDLGAYGTAAFALMEDSEDVIRCYMFPIGSYTLSIGPRGNVNGCFREFAMSVAQLVSKFGLENCSDFVQNQFKTKALDGNVQVIHVIEENPDAMAGKLESKYLPFRSVYYERTSSDKVLEYKGTHEFAVMAPRWRVTGEDTWGNSPAMDCLGDVAQIQQMEKRKLQALDMLLSPPRNVPASLRNEYVGTLAGELTFIPDQANGARVEPSYVINPNLQYIGAEIQNVEHRVKRGLFEDLFLMIAEIDKSGVTATEIQARQQEKLMAMGPVLERLNDEMLDPIVRRTYSILERAGLIPPPPPELQDQPIVIEYISIMAQAMKLQGVVGVERLVGFIGSISAQRPDALDKLNTDEVIDAYADMVGVPPSMVNDAGVIAKIRQARAQQEQQQQAMAMAQQGAQTAKVMADTQTSTPSMLQAMSGALQQAGPMAGVA